MKKLCLFFMFFLPIISFGQVIEYFSDGNFTLKPTWTGDVSNFIVNSSLQLQSNASVATTSSLFTPSKSFENATWDCLVKINYPTSSGTTSTYSTNYASVYLASDKVDINNGCNGYFVQIGGNNDEISLYLQEGTKKTKIIDGIDKRSDGNPVEIRIMVSRNVQGNFELKSKLSTEADFVLEGTTINNIVKSSKYFGLLFVNTAKTGTAYYFDEIEVMGDSAVDREAPIWTTFTLEQPNKLKLRFSEVMDFNDATFNVDQGMGSPISNIISADKMGIELTFANSFEKGKIYNLQTSGLIDLASNVLVINQKSIGITEKITIGDLIFNEIMFENPENSLEYLEIFNASDKVLDVSGLVFTTRKTDGTLNTGNDIPAQTNLLPKGYLALCSDAQIVRNYHACPAESNIIFCTWSTLNNESSTLVLTNSAKDTVYDELSYNTKWHNSWVKDPKGIALERTKPELPTQNSASWHSASSVKNYGTPGYKNSEFMDVEAPNQTVFPLQETNILKLGFSEAMNFNNATFNVDQGIGSPVSKTISVDKMAIELTFANSFEKGKIYKLQTSGLIDLSGNAIIETIRTIGITEKAEYGDLIFNEVMFENPDNSLEYLEIYNSSDKLLDVSGLVFTTRKTDGMLNTGNAIPAQTNILPKGYLALCSDAQIVRNYHACPAESNIITSTWSTLNNESSTLVLTNSAKDTVYDELSYNTKWHHALVKNPKGVALERVNHNLPSQDSFSWHSASSETNYGTPGYKNSQFREIFSAEKTEKFVWTEPEAFSPDNDGVDDICFIRYKTDSSGFVANVIILNALGVKVFQLASNILLSNEGFLTWDGRTESGKNANVGIYVLYFEMFNSETGARKQVKMPIVVSSR